MLKREELETLLLREDLVEYLSKMDKAQIEEILGEKIARMVGFEQKNIHHCYDLFGHTLHTIEGIENKDLSQEELKRLKVAALFHDVGKPDVAKMNEKTGQQVFYGHADKSQEIAKELLSELGYSDKEINQITFYIKHHDDFISYKTKLPDYMKTHEFIREIDEFTVAEKVLENKYDFEKMGLDKDQIRFVCSTLAQGKEPRFTSPNGIIDIKVDMDDVKAKIASDEYNAEYRPSKRDYELLLNLCRADAKAQTELYRQNGKVLCSRKEKLDNMNAIEKNIDDAYRRVEDISLNVRFEKNIIDEIINGANENKELEEKEEQAKELFQEYETILGQEKDKKSQDQQI